MNVTGVGTTPPPQLVPTIAPAVPAAATDPDPDRREAAPGAGSPSRGRRPGERRAEVSVPEAPPLRMLTVTEMRVMLGQLPASAALRSPHGPVEIRETYS